MDTANIVAGIVFGTIGFAAFIIRQEAGLDAADAARGYF